MDPALLCLSKAVYYEASTETRVGQEAVAHVVLNRGGKICKTVYADDQFSWTSKIMPAPYGKAWLEAKDVARSVLGGRSRDPTFGATHFHNTKVYPGWAKRLRFTVKIGRHRFYKDDA